MKLNAIELIDSYKISHVHMYPPKTHYVYSNFTARSNKYSNTLINKDFTVFVGIQATLKLLNEIWYESFFSQPKDVVIDAYRRRVKCIVGTDVDVSHMERLHDLGYLPINVWSLPEGSIVPLRVPYFTLMNSQAGFGWLTNYLEDFFSAESWKMINNATLAYELRGIVEKYFHNQHLDKSLIPFMCHDFSFRGMSGVYDGAKTSFAHLTSFVGSDAVSGVSFAEQYYYANIDKELVSASVPATEHSVMCAGLETGELETFRRLFKLYPTGILSVVSDTWDFFRVITEYAETLKQEILSRDGKLVYRPDSGDPVEILCGTAIAVPNTNVETLKNYVGKNIYHNGHYYKVFMNHDEFNENTIGVTKIQMSQVSNEMKGAVQCLWEVFGGTTNKAGFKTLDSHVGLIYGDSINAERMHEILERLQNKGFAANNVVFGIGSYSYNMSSRDTWGMAMKATWCFIDEKEVAIQKDPKTGDGMKKSATGLLNVFRKPNGDLYVNEYNNYVRWNIEHNNNELKLIYENGKLIEQTTLQEIRNRLWK